MMKTKAKMLNFQINGIAEQVMIQEDHHISEKTFERKDLTYKIEVNEVSAHSALLSIHMHVDQPLTFDFFQLTLEVPAYDAYLYNGYQTWTTSRLLQSDETLKKLNPLGKRFKLNKYGDYDFVPQDRPHSFHYTYLTNQMPLEAITLLASIDESEGYSLFSPRLSQGICYLKKDFEGKVFEPGDHKVIQLLIVEALEEEAFDIYRSFMPSLRPAGQPVNGWTSWYNYYTNIDEMIILDNLESYSNIHSQGDIFQIDDGYQEALGDWLLINDKFPRGLKVIADAIKAKGYVSGLWLAPFVCDKKSHLFIEHPEWIVRDPKGKPVAVGWNPAWSGDFYALNILMPEVQSYLKDVFKTVTEVWGFKMVKLDFLYGVATVPHSGRSRGELMSFAMDFLHDILPETKILGCGVPLGSAFGKVDYCRVSSDVAPYFEDFKLSKIHYRERVSTFNALMSTIHRRHMDGRFFGNDPDVHLLRAGIDLTEREKYTLLMLNRFYGSLIFSSDTLETYDDKTRQLYEKQLKIPPIKPLYIIEESGLYIQYGQNEEGFLLVISNLAPSGRTISTNVLCNLTNEVAKLLKNQDERHSLVDEKTSLKGLYEEVETRIEDIRRIKHNETKAYYLSMEG